MEDNIKKLLESAGIAPETGIERFMGNESMYRKFACRFMDDGNYAALLEAMEAGDAKAAFTAAHTLKGVCGNLSFDRLYTQIQQMVDSLRNGNLDEARLQLPGLTSAYEMAVKALKEWEKG